MVQVRARRHESGRSRLILHDGSAVSRASGLLGRLRQCRWRPGMRRLYPNSVVSSKCASGAGFRGAAARLVSRSSRRRMSARTSASSTAAAGGLQLQRPPAGADFRRRGDKDLGVGIGKNDRADVAAVEHSARRGAAEIALEAEQRRPHLWDRRDNARRPRRTRGLLRTRFIEFGRDRAIAQRRPLRATSSSGCPASSSAFATAR